jgi:hypothetical protein
MSVDSSFSDDLAYAPPSVAARSNGLVPSKVGIVRAATPIVVGATALLVGAGVIAAIATGANIAFSVLVGYCAIASTVAMMLAATRTPQPPRPETDAPAPAVRDTAPAWKLVTTFTVSDASRLLCNVEPGAAATQESIAWGRALIDAIKQGELPMATKAGAAQTFVERERENPHYMTEITREALRAWADQRGTIPAFLRE